MLLPISSLAIGGVLGVQIPPLGGKNAMSGLNLQEEFFLQKRFSTTPSFRRPGYGTKFSSYWLSYQKSPGMPFTIAIHQQSI